MSLKCIVGEDITVPTQTLTLLPGGDEQLQTITVQIIDDSVVEGMEDFSVELGIQRGDTIVALGEISTTTVTIVDNDGMNISLQLLNKQKLFSYFLNLCRHYHWLHSSSTP